MSEQTITPTKIATDTVVIDTVVIDHKKYDDINKKFIAENKTSSLEQYISNMNVLFKQEETELGRPMTYAEMRMRFG